VNSKDMSQLHNLIKLPVLTIHSNTNGLSSIKNPQEFLNELGSFKKVMRVVESPHNIFEYAQDIFTQCLASFYDMIRITDENDNK